VTIDFDILIVGSGPSGVMAAEGSIPTGLRIGMIDAGYVSELSPAPAVPFAKLRNTPVVQQALFREVRSKSPTKSGTQLTPFRAHTIHEADQRLPIHSADFFPLQSLAKGGLSVAWGAASFTYTPDELEKMGLGDLRPYYEKVAVKIGISGPVESPICAIQKKQPMLDIDDNAKKIWKGYQRKSGWFQSRGLHLEPASLAALSQAHGDRMPHPYHDTDFWNNPGNSVFRADFWVDRLISRHDNFSYLPNRLVLKFETDRLSKIVTVIFTDLSTGQQSFLKTKKLLLCAGAINSYRIAATSLGHVAQKNPMLCNPYRLISLINGPMLGKMGREKRHSLAQLFGLFMPEASADPLSLQFYSYRSLFLYRLIVQTPLPTWAARWWWRTLVESLVIVGVHYPATLKAGNWLQLEKSVTSTQALPPLSIGCKKTDVPMPFKLLRLLMGLRCLPLGMINSEPGGSIHYAGTLPMLDKSKALLSSIPGFSSAITTDIRDAALSTCPNVHVLDSSPWRFLPAKGLTLTLMANSLRLSEQIANTLKQQGFQ
jgi:hypothetical protein